MNTKNNIDQLFAPLRETSTDAPMHLWPNVEAAIAKPKKKRRFLWFGLFGFLLLAAASLAVFSQKNKATNNPFGQEQTAQTKPTTITNPTPLAQHQADATQTSTQLAERQMISSLAPIKQKERSVKEIIPAAIPPSTNHPLTDLPQSRPPSALQMFVGN